MNARNNFIFHHLVPIVDAVCAWVDKLRVNILGVILVEDDQVLTSALPPNSQWMLANDVFVHFDDVLREGKVTIRVLIRNLEGSVLGALLRAVERTSSLAKVVEVLTFIHAICLTNIYQFQRVNVFFNCSSLVQQVISTHDNLSATVIL